MPSIRRQEKINSLLKNLAADFLIKAAPFGGEPRPAAGRETSGSIITVTRVETSKDLKSAKIFISIFPERKEKETLDTLNGKKDELRKYIGSQIKMKFLPRLEVEIDNQEKARKKIEEILGKT